MDDYEVPIWLFVFGMGCLTSSFVLQHYDWRVLAAGVLGTGAGSTMLWITRKRKIGDARSTARMIAEAREEASESDDSDESPDVTPASNSLP